MTDSERATIANLTTLRAMQTLLVTFSPDRIGDDSVGQDIGIPLRKWIERLEERLAKEVATTAEK